MDILLLIIGIIFMFISPPVSFVILGIFLILQVSPKARWLFLMAVPVIIVLLLIPVAIPATVVIFISLVILSIVRWVDKKVKGEGDEWDGS